ncbi:MAG TPA: extracellular solute-binding protein [Candidatus Limiplasma sp.]|nr:extracellular solute-binding protein [Candidatus Limiplasma sp.]
MKRVLTLLMAVTLLIGAFAGTAFAATQKIVFCVNIQPQLPVEYWQSIADAYMAANPDVEVEIIGQPSSNVDVFQYEKTLLATGQFPDVMVMQNPADFVPSGALLPFTDEELSYLLDPSLGKIDGVQYVANYKKQVIGVFYNMDMFAANDLAVPTTYQEFLDVCEALKAKDILPVSIGIKDGWPQIMLANMLAGTDLLAKNPNWGIERNADLVKFNNPDLVKAMEKYQYICQNYAGDSLPSITYTQMLEQFFTGQAAMLPMGSWVNAEVAKGLQEFEVGWFPMPGDDNANVLSVFVNEGLSISSYTKYPEVCKDFVKFFFSDRQLYSDFLKGEQLFSTTKEAVPYEMIPLRKYIEQAIVGMQEVEGFESMTGDAAFLPGLKDYYTNKLTQNIAIGNDVATELDKFDAEWDIAKDALN